MKKKISLIGVPMQLGQKRYGVNLGPEALRSAGIMEKLCSFHPDVIDMGNITIGMARQGNIVEKNVRNVNPIAKACSRLADKVSDALADDRFPLVLGGDHSISIGTLAGLAKHYRNLGVIWYDAHADMNTPDTTPSENVHGMPLAASMGLGHPTLVSVGGYERKVKPENIVLVGVRDIDMGEQQLILEKNIKVYTIQDVRRLGITQVMKEVIEYLSQCDGVHLSFDLDGIDPEEAPGVGTPVIGGITYQDSMMAMQVLADSSILTSAEFVEVNPLLDKDNKTVTATIALAGALLGDAVSSDIIVSDPSQQLCMNS